MSTSIGIVSDVHASPAPLKQALEIFAQADVADIICAGDIAGYFEHTAQCIELLENYQCKTIMGNHDESYLQQTANTETINSHEYHYLESLPLKLELTVEQKSIYVVHAEPPTEMHGGIKLLDQQGELQADKIKAWENRLKDFNYDVLIVGHTHQVYSLHIGDTLLINPGSSQFNHSCMILTLPEMSVQTFNLEQKEIVKCWNFSHLFNKWGERGRRD
jgi:putative phosphoesterase